MKISGNDTTANEPNDKGCSGSEIVLIRSKISCSSISSRRSSSSEIESSEEFDGIGAGKEEVEVVRLS